MTHPIVQGSAAVLLLLLGAGCSTTSPSGLPTHVTFVRPGAGDSGVEVQVIDTASGRTTERTLIPWPLPAGVTRTTSVAGRQLGQRSLLATGGESGRFTPTSALHLVLFETDLAARSCRLVAAARCVPPAPPGGVDPSLQWIGIDDRGRAVGVVRFRQPAGVSQHPTVIATLDGEGRVTWADGPPADKVVQWSEGVEAVPDLVELAGAAALPPGRHARILHLSTDGSAALVMVWPARPSMWLLTEEYLVSVGTRHAIPLQEPVGERMGRFFERFE